MLVSDRGAHCGQCLVGHFGRGSGAGPPRPRTPGKRLYLLRHGGKEWLDEDRHSRIAVETRMGHEVAGVEGLYSHVALTLEQEIADSLQSRWLRRSWSAR
ncbi:hypothetical protein SCWH03_10100 [Streptomyces pacificus]|uniref:Uncharacterized protein n=1 Tax=Streptomyces pacificus TaxID=2705029 RepID=A0A6A0AP75_9ACTN|nr:hypothetical protein SCWH03_10100 [Streptomyces pacificus]